MNGYPIDRFVREFTDLMDQERAALFCGAGTSIPVGMKDWRVLLEGIAANLGLKVEFVTDLVELAQFNLNERGTRNEIHELIIEEYARRAAAGPLHEQLVRLPVDMVWTTNYDQVLEAAYEANGQRPDVKATAGSLGAHPRLWDVQIFKMHGDVRDPEHAVLTKFDYDRYPYDARGRGFLTALEVAMLSRSFLFLGFSFNDPNIDRILSRLSVMHDRGQRVHYCIMKRPAAPVDGPDRVKAEHEVRLVELRINDLRERFKIQTVLVENFDDIPRLIAQLARASRRNHVFVSGAAQDHAPLGEDRLISLAEVLGARLARDEKVLISGFGLGIGQDVVRGFFDEAYTHAAKDLTDRAVLRPFPQRVSTDATDGGAARRTRYRRDMLSRAGFVIYLAGNKLQSGEVVQSTGVREEFNIAEGFGAIPIPIGATGSVAEELWRIVLGNPTKYYGDTDVQNELETLGRAGATNQNLIDAAFALMRKVIAAILPTAPQPH